MRRHWFLAIAGAIAAALAVAPLSAFAASAVLTVGSTSGPAVAAGDTLNGSLNGSATFVNSSNSGQKVTCTSSGITARDVTNPASGVATETVSSQTFGGCTLTGVFGASVNSITTNASSTCPWKASVDDRTSPATVTIAPATGGGSCPTTPVISADVKITAFGTTIDCVYSPTSTNISGTAPLASSAGITFTNQGFTKSSGPGTCFSPANFSATYAFADQTQSNGAVFTN